MSRAESIAMWLSEAASQDPSPLVEGDVEHAASRGWIGLRECQWLMSSPTAITWPDALPTEGCPLAIAKRMDRASIPMLGLLTSPRPLTIRIRFDDLSTLTTAPRVQWHLEQAHLLDYALEIDATHSSSGPMERWHIAFQRLRIDHQTPDGRLLSADIVPPPSGQPFAAAGSIAQAAGSHRPFLDDPRGPLSP